MALKRNVVANYFGQGWRVLMSLAFVPWYIKYLGIEAYGLVGIFALLQVWLGLLDIGMQPVLGREMARFTAGAHDRQSIRDLLRSIEIIALTIGGLIVLGIWLASDWLATDWVKAENISTQVVSDAFHILGCVVALAFVQNIYVSALVGLQKQVVQNVVISIVATVRGLGAIGVLIWISPTIQAFFFWQAIVALISLVILAAAVYRSLPPPSRIARFSSTALAMVWKFAAGMVAISFLALLLTQVDKVILSRLLTLEEFGYYTLAGLVSGALYMLGYPVMTAFYPRFVELIATGNGVELRKTYHQSAQLVTILMGSAAVVLIACADLVLRAWTADPDLARHVAPLLAVLSLGVMLNGIIGIPYQMQIAHGWTTLAIKINIVAVAILIPAVLWVVPRFGAIGAAWVWVALNAGYVLIGVHFMYRRILTEEKWTWYRSDVVFPLAVATITASACRWVMPEDMGRLGSAVAVVLTSSLVLIATCISAPHGRSILARYLPPRFLKHGN